MIPARFRRLVPSALIGLAIGLWGWPAATHAEAVIVVSPVSDRNDRIDAILASALPPLSVQRIGLAGMAEPHAWGRASGETEPARLTDARLVVLENAHRNGLADTATDSGESLLDTLPRWVRDGGHLLIVGGHPSYETYPDSPLMEVLPVVPAVGRDARSFLRRIKRRLSGDGDGRYVEHVHAVTKTRGEVLIKAQWDPFAVRRRVGRGLVLAVLGGANEYFVPHTGPDEDEFFASPVWERFLIDTAGSALGRPLGLGRIPDPTRLAIPAARTGARIRREYWFPDARRGRLALRAPSGPTVWTGRPDADGWYTLPEELRHGVYRAVWEDDKRSRERDVRIGGTSDPTEFDIRFASLSHGPYPYGKAPGEAHARARELADVGITSVVFGNHWSRREQSQRDIRALREIIGAGLDIVYLHTLALRLYGKKWPYEGRWPQRARNLAGKEVGWDVHDEAFRRGIDQVLDVVGEVRALPNIRALNVIEEFGDGGLRSPSLQGEMQARGLRGDEQPGEPGWFLHEEIRSRATGETFQRFRRMAHRFLPGVPHATYWPGSYWGVPRVYTLRVPELARAVDELIGPGYGYQNREYDGGWHSVVRSAAEIFAAHGHRLAEGRGTAIYALGRTRGRRARAVVPRAWRDTAWTALAHGATFLAYFDMPRGKAMQPLAALHDEMFRIGPWIAAARRRPAALALLASWTTRSSGTEEETRRHLTCRFVIQFSLAESVEEVDLLLEEQVAAPPAELRAVVVAAVPLLTAGTIAHLTRFAEQGGTLFLEPGAGKASPEGPRSGDPWARARATGRVHDLRLGPVCKTKPSFWPTELAKRGIEPESRTAKPRTGARLRGDGEILYWLLLNHGEEPALVNASARVEANRFEWRDLRSGAPVVFSPGSRVSLERLVGPGDAAALIGVRRPAAAMEVTATATETRVEIDVAVRDSEGEAVADGYPVRVAVVDSGGAPRVPPKARSRVTRGGRAHWTVPIPLETASTRWSVLVEEPVSKLRRSASVEVTELAAGDVIHDGEEPRAGERQQKMIEVGP
jgi:hypothetical protein